MNAIVLDQASQFVQPDSARAERRRKRRRIFAALVAGKLVLAGAAWFLSGGDHVATDNAYVNADSAQVIPLVAGPVSSVEVVNTQKVRKGQILVRLDDTDARLALARAEAEWERVRRQYGQTVAASDALSAQIAAGDAEVLQAQAQVQIASSAFEKARVDFDRRSRISDSGAVSAEELTTARNSYDAARGNLAQARAGLAQAQAAKRTATGNHAATAALVAGSTIDTFPDVAAARARLEQARVDLARTIIRAPIDGIVTNRQVQVGQRVATNSAIMTIVPVDSAYVDANFKEGQLARVRIGQPVELVSDIYGSDVVYHGRVAGFSGGTGAAFSLIPAQNATGNWIKVVQRLPVRVTLDPRELAAHPLRVGLSMEATIDVSGDK